MGDFNANPDSQTYAYFLERGFVSSHKEVHGKEPTLTFPTNLKAEYMDTDPAGTFDFIFVKGNCSITTCEVSGGNSPADDDTISGSDHWAVCATI